jgi:hypothetical protein
MSLYLRQLVLFTAVLVGMAPVVRAGAAENWPQFRGPLAQGVADDVSLPDVWSATENIAWRTPIPGRGWSSPIAWGDRIFLTCVSSADDQVERKRGLYFGGDQK